MFKGTIITFACLALCVLVMGNDKAGVRLAIKQDVVLDFERKFLPLVLQNLGTINIPDQHINVDVKIGTLHIDLEKIHINISKLLADNISVNFVSPNYIDINARDIEGSGGFKAKYKLSFYSETDDVTITVKWVNVNSRIALGTQPSNKVPGKLLPSATIETLNLDLDFDFNIKGSIIAKVADLIKGVIKKKLMSIIKEIIQKQIVQESKEIIDVLINKLPVYVPLPGDLSLAVDYSLLANPKVENSYLIVSSNGAIVDLRHPESMNPPYETPDTLPDYDVNGKKAQTFITDYSVNTAANSLYLSGALNLLIKSTDVPKQFLYQLNTTMMETLLPGIKDKYGPDQPVNIACQASGVPTASINTNLLTGILLETCQIIVILDNSQEIAYSFKTQINAEGMVTIAPQGEISGNISKIKLSNSEQIDSKLPNADIKMVEMMFNFAAPIALPFINEKFLKNIHIKLPIVEGISFDDSTLDAHDRYIEVNLNPVIVQSWLNSFLEDLEVSFNEPTIKFLEY